jgi:dihydrolipoamide dehydrogenase
MATLSHAQALLHSSHIYHGAKSDYSNYGVMVDNVQIDLKKMMAQKDKAVLGLTKGVEGLFKKNKVGSCSTGSNCVAGCR